MFENDGVRCWHTGDDIAIVSFKSRMHAIGEDVLDGMLQAIERPSAISPGLVIWQTEPPFSVGANLKKGQRRRAPREAVGGWRCCEGASAPNRWR
jgi:3-hydroxyacyl-CoA dehydrogenase